MRSREEPRARDERGEAAAMFAFVTFGLAICFSALLPFAILSLRRSVRLHRQSIILDLERVFELEDANGRQEKIVPSFEFVKYKYFANPGSSGADDSSRLVEKSAFAFAVCSVPLVLLVFAFSVFALSVVIAKILPASDAGLLMPPFRHLTSASLGDREWAIFWVFAVAFFGGYLFAVRGLLRAVNNFDLTPGSFISAALQLLLGVTTAMIIVAGGIGGAIVDAPGAGLAVSTSIVAAFLIGFIPEFGLRALYRASQLWLFKREDTDLYRSFRATPVEVIDGIDTETRSRLAEFNIFTVQNLATANPIMLFVETPYGIYQSIDWVAQAQLCAAVGPHAVLRLWKLGIRTIFDLEKAVLGEGYTTRELRQAVGMALLADADEATIQVLQTQTPSGRVVDDDTIKAVVENKIDDLHVHRLRQITNHIAQRLGPENR